MTVIERIAIDPAAANKNWALGISKKLGVKPEFMTKEELVSDFAGYSPEEIFPRSKKTLFFTENKGVFLKKCPGSRGVVCCDYHTINSVTGCPFDCSYCILQHYIINNPFITVFTNRDQAVGEIAEYLQKNSRIRVGTGELADSLAFDDILDETGFFLDAIKKNGWEDRVQFEFKTKSDRTVNLSGNMLKYPGCNIVAGFSVNIESFRATDERHTATMEERFSAMLAASAAGAKIAIHFDPLVMLDKNFESYMFLVDTIFTRLKSAEIVWISMGGFRHTLGLTATIRERFPQSQLLLGEMFPSDDDNKMRYLSTVRRKFYRAMKERIGRHIANPPLYLCMEKPFMWEDAGMPCKFPDFAHAPVKFPDSYCSCKKQ